MIVLVCGGRDYRDVARVKDVLDRVNDLKPITKIVAGGATGADTAGVLWAMEQNVDKQEYFPDYKKYHPKKAPFMRNTEMLIKEQIDLVVAFPGNNGTADMVTKAEKRDIFVIRSPR